MNVNKDTVQIFLNSKDRLSGTPTDCIYSLPYIQNIYKESEIYVSIQSCEIPSSFYTIDDINNSLYYEINSGGVQNLAIPQGNYNVNDLKSYLMAQISNLTITYDTKTNKLTFTHSLYDFTIFSTSTCLELLGFSEADHSSTSSVLTSDTSVNLFPIKSLNIVSNNFITNNITTTDLNNASYLLSIPNSSTSFGIIFYENRFNVNTKLKDINNFTHLHIKLVDQNGNVIDLNGLEWSLAIQIDILTYYASYTNITTNSNEK